MHEEPLTCAPLRENRPRVCPLVVAQALETERTAGGSSAVCSPSAAGNRIVLFSRSRGVRVTGTVVSLLGHPPAATPMGSVEAFPGVVVFPGCRRVVQALSIPDSSLHTPRASGEAGGGGGSPERPRAAILSPHPILSSMGTPGTAWHRCFL